MAAEAKLARMEGVTMRTKMLELARPVHPRRLHDLRGEHLEVLAQEKNYEHRHDGRQDDRGVGVEQLEES